MQDEVMYMPIAYNLEEIKTVLAYENINIVGVEMIAKNSEEELFQIVIFNGSRNRDYLLGECNYTWRISEI